MRVGSLISGSRIPLFFLVARIEIQSDNGPFVAKPIRAPMKSAKLKNPIVCDEYEYGGLANAALCVRFADRKPLADQDTTKEASSTIGKKSSSHGVIKLMTTCRMLLVSICQSLNCFREGYPFRNHGDRFSVGKTPVSLGGAANSTASDCGSSDLSFFVPLRACS